MFRLPHRTIAVSTSAIVLSLALATAAAAQTPTASAYKPLHQIGTSTAFHKPALTTASSLQRLIAVRGMTDDVRKVLRDSGIPETADGVVAALSGARSSSATSSLARRSSGWLSGPMSARATERRGVSSECAGREHGRSRHFSSR